MRYLICYDISENKLRNNIVKKLFKFGCDRIQKSVFISISLKTKEYRLMNDELRVIVEKFGGSGDSILFFPMDKNQLELSKCIGNDKIFKNINSQLLTKYF